MVYLAHRCATVSSVFFTHHVTPTPMARASVRSSIASVRQASSRPRWLTKTVCLHHRRNESLIEDSRATLLQRTCAPEPRGRNMADFAEGYARDLACLVDPAGVSAC